MKLRLSNNTSWATEFEASTFEEFEREWPAAMERCAGRLVSLHRWDDAHGGMWFGVGNVQMGVFYDGTDHLRACQAGRWEIRGNGHEFLSVSPQQPCSDVVWAEIHNQRPPRNLERVDCRLGQTPHQRELQQIFSLMTTYARTGARDRDGSYSHRDAMIASGAAAYVRVANETTTHDWAAWEEWNRRAGTPAVVIDAVMALAVGEVCHA